MKTNIKLVFVVGADACLPAGRGSALWAPGQLLPTADALAVRALRNPKQLGLLAATYQKE